MFQAHLTQKMENIGLKDTAWHLYLFSIGISFFVMIEPAPTDLVFFMSLFALVLAGAQTRRLLRPIEVLAAVFLVWSVLLSLVFVQTAYVAAIRAVAVEIYMVLLYLMTIYFVKNKGDAAFSAIMWMLLVGGVISSTLGVLAYFDMIPAREIFFRDQYMSRIKSTFKDPNVFGPFLVPSILFCVWIAVSKPASVKFILPVLSVILLCLVLAFSRGAVLHTGISLMVFMSCLMLHRKTSLSASIGVLLVGIATILVILLFQDKIIAAASGSVLSDRLAVQYYDNSRFADILRAMILITERPLGVGPMQSWYVYQYEPHNTYVVLSMHSGILAGICFTLLYFAAIFRCLKKVLAQKDGWLKYALVLSSLLGLFVLMNVVSSLHWRHMWVVMGLAYGAYGRNTAY